MIRIDGIILELSEEESALKIKAAKKAGINKNEIKYFKILKKSIDARKGTVHFVYSVELDVKEYVLQTAVEKKYSQPANPPVIIGSGPAGLFCALVLARRGFCPIVIERGGTVDERKNKIGIFIETAKLDTSTNVQFGEGGAGTFSDGKLNTGVRSEFKDFILNEFVLHGAPEEITYDARPHIGSDKLPFVVKSIREEIISLGGKFMFNTAFFDMDIDGGRVNAVRYKGKENGELAVSDLVLATGHSSRDTFKMLYEKGVCTESKDMAVGFRIEHLQSEINKSQYGKFASSPKLKAASYKLTSSASNRGVFTFCMCPGGTVVAATSEENAVVTNGMSEYARDKVNANSAVVVQIKKEDYGKEPLAGIDYLTDLEKKAFILGGGGYKAPVQLLGDFLEGRVSSSFGNVLPSYPLGTTFAPVHTLLRGDLTDAIRKGISDMDKRLKGFAAKDAVLTAIESRTSSPIRVVRGENLNSVNIENLYPIGEVGYAGGIMSAAIDGVKAANKISEKYSF